jgi:hypothetical protein
MIDRVASSSSSVSSSGARPSLSPSPCSLDSLTKYTLLVTRLADAQGVKMTIKHVPKFFVTSRTTKNPLQLLFSCIWTSPNPQQKPTTQTTSFDNLVGRFVEGDAREHFAAHDNVDVRGGGVVSEEVWKQLAQCKPHAFLVLLEGNERLWCKGAELDVEGMPLSPPLPSPSSLKRQDRPLAAAAEALQPKRQKTAPAKELPNGDANHANTLGAVSAATAQGEQAIATRLEEIKQAVIDAGIALACRQVRMLETLQPVLDRAHVHVEAVKRDRAEPTTIAEYRAALERMRGEYAEQRELLDLFAPSAPAPPPTQ